MFNITGENPENYIGGTWIAWGSGRVPVGIDIDDSDFNAIEKIGGEKSHTLTADEMPPHKHGLNNHKHTIPAQTVISQSNNTSHTHHIPQLSGSTSSNGEHDHVEQYLRQKSATFSGSGYNALHYLASRWWWY